MWVSFFKKHNLYIFLGRYVRVTASTKHKWKSSQKTNRHAGLTTLPNTISSWAIELQTRCWFFLLIKLSLVNINKKSVVQELYEHLSLKKKGPGNNVFVFWDQKCLNFGQNWQEGFLLGLQNSSVIVLLISSQVNFFLFSFFFPPFFFFSLLKRGRHWMEYEITLLQRKTMCCWNIFFSSLVLYFYGHSILLLDQSMNLHCFLAFHVAHLSYQFLWGLKNKLNLIIQTKTNLRGSASEI